MTGRRSHPRFSFGQARSGAVRVLRDVVVCRTAEAELLAISQAAGVIGEQMSLELIATVGSITLRVQVLGSLPVIIDGALRHRVRLGIVSEAARDMPNHRTRPDGHRSDVATALDAVLQANDVVGVVGRHMPVRLIDLSTSGCLLESWVRLDVGTHATVRVAHDGLEFSDDVRVARSQPSAGSSGVFQVGAEFLWTKPPTERSMRMILAREDASRD